jgi:hypothetical protein
MSDSIEAAREFLMSRAGSFPEDPHPTVIELAAFADQISEQRVKAERKRLYKELDKLGNHSNHRADFGYKVDLWMETEFAEEIGGTDVSKDA